MGYKLAMHRLGPESAIGVVGCGGTGGYVAEGLCRLLLKSNLWIVLIDPQRVESRNLKRQNFFEGDVGKFKSQALAERLSRKYGRQIPYSVYPFQENVAKDHMGNGLTSVFNFGLLIGCVDGPEGRRAISFGNQQGSWWMDSGNGENSGQVLIGNASQSQSFHGTFCKSCQTVGHLPIPSVQSPSLLAPVTKEKDLPANCAEAVEREDQSPVINQVMASIVLEMTRKLLNGTLTWMGVYVDMDAGGMRAIEATPEEVSRLVGVNKKRLTTNSCQSCYRRL